MKFIITNKVLKTEMDKNIKHKQIHIKVGQNNKRRKIKNHGGMIC